jgi:predicted lysophospholipase L1 biosynthesis ABC-type transport system permease subunit
LPDPNVENVCFDKTRNADDIKHDEPTLKTESMKAGEEALTGSVVVESKLSLDVESQTNTDHAGNREASSETSSGAATSDKRKLSDMSKVDDPWSANGKLSTILHSTPNAVIYSVIDHSTLINKEHIIKISGKGCGKFPDKHIC